MNMSVIIKRTKIKHDLTDIAERAQNLSADLAEFADALSQDDNVDITLLDQTYMDFWCGDKVDEMREICGKFSDFIDSYREQLLKDFRKNY